MSVGFFAGTSTSPHESPDAAAGGCLARRVNEPLQANGTQRITIDQLWGLELWRRRIWSRDTRRRSPLQGHDHADVKQPTLVHTLSGLATQRCRAGRERLTAFGQRRRFARLVVDRLRRMRVVVAGRSRFVMRCG